MHTLNYRFPAAEPAGRRAHIGVVASGDLEILVRPPTSEDAADTARVRVRTSVDGFDTIWQAVLHRFFTRTPIAGVWELNDCGATPGVVALRLRQAADATRDQS